MRGRHGGALRGPGLRAGSGQEKGLLCGCTHETALCGACARRGCCIFLFSPDHSLPACTYHLPPLPLRSPPFQKPWPPHPPSQRPSLRGWRQRWRLEPAPPVPPRRCQANTQTCSRRCRSWQPWDPCSRHAQRCRWGWLQLVCCCCCYLSQRLLRVCACMVVLPLDACHLPL